MPGSEAARERLYRMYASTHVLPHATSASDKRQSRVFARLYGAHLPKDRRASIVDLGCGQGAFVAHLRALGYTYAVGVDASAEQVALARQVGVPVEEANVISFLAGHESRYHLITAFDLLEHLDLDDVLALVDVVATALVPGGTFVFQSACADGPFGGRYRYGDLTHTTAFTARSAEQLLRIAGFERIRIRPVRPVVTGFTSALRHAVWRSGEIALRILLAAETGERRKIVLTQNLIASARRPFTIEPGVTAT